MKKRKVVLLALAATVCMTGCFDKYSEELSADEAKAICQAIIDNSEKTDFVLPTQYGIEAQMLYESDSEKSDILGTLIMNKEKSYVYLDAKVKEGSATEYSHTLYFLYDDAENNQYLEGVVSGEEKKLNILPKASYTAEAAYARAEEKVTTKAKDWIVQTQILQLLVDSLLIDTYVKGLHIAENLPDLSFIEPLDEIKLNEYECSMTSDGDLNIDVRYRFKVAEIDTDITASWKDGFLQSGDIYAKDETRSTTGTVKQVSYEPVKPDTTGYTTYSI